MTRFLTHPAMVLGVLAGLAVLLLALPIRLPIGGNYFDLYFIMDGAYRVGLGQVPHADFFAPSGALPFYLLAGAEWLFPKAQPLLAAQLSLLAVTLPLITLAAIDVDRRSRLAAFAIVVPFAIFSLAPINAIEFYPAPGADGIGVYNRQSGLALYALMAAMFLMAEGWRRNLVLALALAALFYIKINVFLPALVLMAFGFVSGLLAARSAATVFGAAVVAIVAAGAPTGLLAPYLSDIAAMVAHNSGHALSRMATMFSVKFDVIMTMSALIVALLALRFAEIWRLILKLAHGPAAERLRHLRRLLQLDVALIGVGFVMAVVIEMQNTGSQEFVYLWPLLLAALTRLKADAEPRSVRWKPALMMLFAAAALPTFVTILHRTARMIAVAPTYASLGLPELKALDRVVVRPENLAHARAMSAHYAGARANYAALAEAGHMPSSILWSHIEYQAFYLLDLAEAAAALRRLEARTGRSFASVYTPDNVDMMPYALGRAPLKDVTVSLDFGRGFPASRQAKLIAAAGRADAIFLRRCPMTPYALDIVKLMQPALAGRDMIALTPCWDVAVKR
jgi:hypothetical protein